MHFLQLSVSRECKSMLRMFFLKDNNVSNSLIFLGTIRVRRFRKKRNRKQQDQLWYAPLV